MSLSLICVNTTTVQMLVYSTPTVHSSCNDESFHHASNLPILDFASNQFADNAYDRRVPMSPSISTQSQDTDPVKVMKNYFDLIVNKMTSLDEVQIWKYS